MTQPVWTNGNLANPHEVTDKAQRVQSMFSAIAPSYDLNNRLHSMWRDQAWRRAAVKAADVKSDDVVLDVACGTGDLSLAFASHKTAQGGGCSRVIGVDFTYDMLTIANQKNDNTDFQCVPTYQTGDAMHLPIADQRVDVVSIAFGIRNVSNPQLAIAEFNRVLRPGGRVIILEFSLPRNALMRGLYNFYFKHIMPRTATLISGDRSGAYKYLPKSVNTFIEREQMTGMLKEVGFTDVTVKTLTFGIAVIYRGVKT